MSINYDKLFNPDKMNIDEDVSSIDKIIQEEEMLFAISEEIIKYRKQNNLTQLKLAQKLDVNQTMISKLESGEYNPTIKQLFNISFKLTNSTDLFLKILKNIDRKIEKVTSYKYNAEYISKDISKQYKCIKEKDSKVINIKYNGDKRGEKIYDSFESTISNVG